ncbi:MAG: isochorismate synthase MenF [Thermoplasmatota archaeon]
MTAPVEQAMATLREARGQPRFFLAIEGTVRFGVGIHRRLEESGPDRLRTIANAARLLPKDAMVLGGFAFDDAHDAAAPWQAFPSALFVVPALEWEWRDGEWVERRNGANAELPEIEDRPVRDRPDSRAWATQVGTALQAISSGFLSKVVLARCERRPAIDDPLAAFARLVAAEPLAHAFYFEPIPGHAFFGATPERLARLRHGRLETHAVAGTAPRGTKGTDANLGNKLLVADKESREHRLVVEHIVARLEALGLTPEQGMRRLRRMANVQHLETQVTAAASAGLHVLDVAATLHPTPAVCGTPVDEAKGLIAQLEARPRGWYAGGLGWFNQAGEGEILVALRSALATPDGTWLYAGAGIVVGSDANAEYKETEAKLKALEEALA